MAVATHASLLARRADPTLEILPGVRFNLEGVMRDRLRAVTEQWILPAPAANPRLLEMFRLRERGAYPDQVGWAGEFAGKYLTHAVQILRLTGDDRLRKHLDWFVGELVSMQAEDGYLGPWPKAWRLRKGSPICAEPWDAWGHYHVMLGLLMWQRDTGDVRALAAAGRIGDLFCNRFLDGPEKLHDTGAHEMNQAPIHSLLLLHHLTGEPRYLAMARKIEAEFELPPAGDYVRTALAGKEFFETPKPRWESLHPIMGLAELYYATGDKKYFRAFEHLWWSMLKGDRHNNGGFTSGEQAYGDPYSGGAIETCCTVAWMAMSVEMLRLTGDPVVADEIELSLFNSGLGLISPSGRWVTYNTPMDGRKEASAHTIVFQARAGSSELNCCSVNGPRLLGMVSDWAVMRREDGLTLNWFGPGSITAPLPDGQTVTFTQTTDYPRDPAVVIDVMPDKAAHFTLALRIPYWSERTSVSLNGNPIAGVAAGKYLLIDRTWSAHDRIDVAFDFRPHFWPGRVWLPARPSEAWNTTWQVIGPIPNGSPGHYSIPQEHLALDRVTAVPESWPVGDKTLKPVRVESIEGWIDLSRLLGGHTGHPVAWLYTEVHTDEPRDVSFAYGSDWWTTVFLNGVRVGGTEITGGNNGPAYPRRHEVTVRLQPGRNLLAFRVISGTGGWVLNVGKIDSPPPPQDLVPTSIYRGPILLAFDPRLGDLELEACPGLDAAKLDLRPVTTDGWLQPWMAFDVVAADGRTVRLCDFASAGVAGNEYRSWLPVRYPAGPPKIEFTRSNPLRSFRAGSVD